MIYLDLEGAAERDRSSEAVAARRSSIHPDALERSILAEYRDSKRGYLIRRNGMSHYRFIRLEEGRKDYCSALCFSQYEALEAAYEDRIDKGWGIWADSWVDKMLRDIAELKPVEANSPQSLAAKSFAKRLLAIYGDADLGYLIGQTALGRYRFIHYSVARHDVSSSFSTELAALEAALYDCISQDERHWRMDWAQDLLSVIEAKDGSAKAAIDRLG